MSRIVFGLLLFAFISVSQAGVLKIENASYITFNGYSDQPYNVTGAKNDGFLGTLVTTSAGIFTATYLGNESYYTDSYHFGAGNGALLETNKLGATISLSVEGGIVNFGFSDNFGLGHTFNNGDKLQYDKNQKKCRTSNPIMSFAIMDGQTKKYGKFDYILGFNDSYTGDADYDDFVVGVNFISTPTAPVPEPESYAMMLAGLGLLGFSVRRRKSGIFD